MTALACSEFLELPGPKIIRPAVFTDNRGFFLETYNAGRYAEAGIDVAFVQDNHSCSVKNTVRGLHYQSSPGQAKLVRVTVGAIWDVVVDIRPDSPTFGTCATLTLDAEKHDQLFIPVGFAHGFCVLSNVAEVQYKVSTPYDPKTECGFHYADAELQIPWPVTLPLVSERDQRAESFGAFRRRVKG